MPSYQITIRCTTIIDVLCAYIDSHHDTRGHVGLLLHVNGDNMLLYFGE